jgi:hypothetical protein
MGGRLADVTGASPEFLILFRDHHRQGRSARKHLTQMADPVAGAVQNRKHDGRKAGREAFEQEAEVMQSPAAGGTNGHEVRAQIIGRVKAHLDIAG